MMNLRLLGFRANATLIEPMSLAGRCRVAMSGSSHAAALQLIAEAQESDDALLHYSPNILGTSIVKSVEKAYYTVHNLATTSLDDFFASTPRKLNKFVADLYATNYPTSLHDFLQQRLRWWLRGQGADDDSVDYDLLVSTVVSTCRAAAKLLPLHVVAAYLKTVANAWITSSRLGGAPLPCFLKCEGAAHDSITHTLFCPCLRAAAQPYMPTGYAQWPMSNSLQEMLCVDGAPTAVRINRVIWIEVAMHCSNVLRRQSYDIKGLVKARVRALCRESQVIRRIMVEHRASGHQVPQQPPSLLDW